ncbi:hypothetical protein C8Q74DRAFT_1286300 [Fomes fomentarius]|nr:hypothetical protein C8Q74DRAFT_1286300 [Fomes fomentarius]
MYTRDHFAPHNSRDFEGYYTRVQLADGATLAIIFCWVKRVEVRANYVLVSYLPAACSSKSSVTSASSSSPSSASTSSSPKPLDVPLDVPLPPNTFPSEAFKYEFFPPYIEVIPGDGEGAAVASSSLESHPHTTISSSNSSKNRANGGHIPFTISAPGIGRMVVTPHTIEYAIDVPPKNLRVHLMLDEHTPWSPTHPLKGPMGGILHLSSVLPLNWHVRSTSSRATYSIAHGAADTGSNSDAETEREVAAVTLEGVGRAHVEKNWGGSFPQGWIWAQTFSARPAACPSPSSPQAQKHGDGEGEERAERTLCLAGGAAFPGVQAYLVGYRSPTRHWDFRPPFALAVCRLSPFMRVKRDSQRGEVEFRVGTWTRKLKVKITAPPASFIELSAPLKDGHEPGFAHESFQARVDVEASTRRWPWGKWEVVERGVLGRTEEGVPCGALEFGGSYYHHKAHE